MSEVSSTGQLGYSVRSDARNYCNNPYLVTQETINTFLEATRRHLDTVGTTIGRTAITRTVMRAVTDAPSLQHLQQAAPFASRLEAAVPLPTGEYMVYLARNSASRGSGLTPALIKSAAAACDVDRTDAALPPGLRIVDRVHNPGQLRTLWRPTFGWNWRDCRQLAQRVAAQSRIDPAQRNVWFSGAEDASGNLLAAAMAERLDMPSRLGNIALVESTEWATLPGRRGQRLMPAVVRNLSVAVDASLREIPHATFAECNILSGAHIAAVRAGFEAPQPDSLHPHILVDNVHVGDGLEPTGGYRSFLLLVAPGEMV